ncbi:hypothetical protein H6G91_21335 [Nostoc muscorum FACHB-395]|nr:hypothetical protein [Desmonostoc muscorum FACHB-395]
MSERQKSSLEVALESLPIEYRKSPVVLILYSCFLFFFTWFIITFIIWLFVIMPLASMGMKDLIYECTTLQSFNEISKTCTTKGWVTFIHNIVSFSITVFLLISPTTRTHF